MRIRCVHCGERGNEEFAVLGDATVERPDASGPLTDEAIRIWHDYVHLRTNPEGVHRELWYHAAGCRAWLVVDRDTRTHEVLAVAAAREVALRRRADAADGGQPVDRPR